MRFTVFALSDQEREIFAQCFDEIVKEIIDVAYRFTKKFVDIHIFFLSLITRVCPREQNVSVLQSG